MPHHFRHLAFTLLLAHATASNAVQLGSVKGSAVFGQTLDLTIAVRLDNTFDEAANCFTADVYQADTRFDVGRVRIDVIPAANGLDANVRVRSTTKINEPWAKVVLSSNCGSKVSKHYELLTDFSPDASANAVTQAQNKNAVTPVLPSVNSPATKTATTTPAIPAAISATGAGQVSASMPALPKAKAKSNTLIQTSKSQATTTTQKSQRLSPPLVISKSKANTPATTETGKSRLKMEAFELNDEHTVLLKLSNALVSPASTKTPEETQALVQATAVWRAINGMPAIDDKLAAAAAENEKKQKATAAIAAASVKLANQKLEETTEFYSYLVYGLLGLLAIALGCLVWFWLKIRKNSQTEFTWLSDAAEDKQSATATHEPTQFLPTALGGTEPEDIESIEPVLEYKRPKEAAAYPSHKETNSTLADNPLATLLSDNRVIKKKNKPSNNTSTDLSFETVSTQVPAKELAIDEAPLKFTEERFDERVSKSKKKNRNSFEHKPIAPVAETIDFDMTDITSKTHASVSASVSNTPSTKEDVKSNLIDFDIFADPPATDKP